MLARIGVFILWSIHFLPFRVIVAIGNGLGYLLYLFSAERRRVGDINLKLCFPGMSDEGRPAYRHSMHVREPEKPLPDRIASAKTHPLRQAAPVLASAGLAPHSQGDARRHAL